MKFLVKNSADKNEIVRKTDGTWKLITEIVESLDDN